MTGRLSHRRGRSPRTMLMRTAAAVAAVGLVASSSACGFRPQQKSEAPRSHDLSIRGGGVNLNMGTASHKVMVRDLLVISRKNGSGFLSAGIQAPSNDTLQKVSGRPVDTHGKTGKPVDVSMAGSMHVGTDLLVLVDHKPVRLRSPGLKAGLTVKLKLSFEHAGSKQVEAPVVDGNNSTYETVQPKSS